MAFLKPPFRAEDMEGLYNKVSKGVFQRLPGHYSVDMNEFVNLMLKVNPKARYSAAELLSLPMVIEKINTGGNLKENAEEGKATLLQTIKFPANLQYLTDKLPKPNYEPMKMAHVSNFEGFGSIKLTSVGHTRAEVSQIRNRSAASKAGNRSTHHENSIVNSSQLPALGVKKRQQVNHLVSASAEDQLIKDRLNKQHNRVEQEIKKYDEILKRNKNLRQQYQPKQRQHKVLASYDNNHSQIHNGSLIERSENVSNSGKDLIKINGVKLENRNLDARRGAQSRVHHDASYILEPRLVNSRLPALGKISSQPKGLAAKYSRLR